MRARGYCVPEARLHRSWVHVNYADRRQGSHGYARNLLTLPVYTTHACAVLTLELCLDSRQSSKGRSCGTQNPSCHVIIETKEERPAETKCAR